MKPETPRSSIPIASDEEISSSLPIVGESLLSIFPYVWIRLADTNSTVLSSLSATMFISTHPPFTYPITSTNGPYVSLTSDIFVGPQSSSLSGSGTTFHFGMGSSLVIGSGVPSTKQLLQQEPLFLEPFLYGVH